MATAASTMLQAVRAVHVRCRLLRHLPRAPCQVLPLRVKLYRSYSQYGWLHFSGVSLCPLLPADHLLHHHFANW
jgi:hypothetical protein